MLLQMYVILTVNFYIPVLPTTNNSILQFSTYLLTYLLTYMLKYIYFDGL